MSGVIHAEGVLHAFSDGGCVGPNPSRHGGTWAFVLIGAGDVEVERGSGLITAAEAHLPAVSSPYSELLACLKALDRLPDGWAGTLWTDNWASVCRLVNERPGMVGIPTGMQRWVWRNRERLGAFKVVLLDGHPSKAQLAAGTGKRGNPVSRFNVLCDELCTEQSRLFMERFNADNPAPGSGVATVV